MSAGILTTSQNQSDRKLSASDTLIQSDMKRQQYLQAYRENRGSTRNHQAAALAAAAAAGVAAAVAYTTHRVITNFSM